MKPVSIRLDLSQIFGIDLRSLALFRVGLALVLLFDLFLRVCNVGAFYTDSGVLPRSAQIEIYSDLSAFLCVHLWSGALGGQMVLFALAFAAAFALLVGYRTFWATFISWFLLLSVHNRNPMVLQGGDILLGLMLFWSLFLPLGARASLDQLLASTSSVPEKTSSISPLLVSTGTLAALLQVCFVYWFTSAMKTDASWRVDGTALGYALSIDQLVKPFGRYLLGFPDLLRQLTFLTVAIERFGPWLALLPFWRLRLGMVGVFIGFHMVMGLCLTLGIFTWIAPVAWLLFIPSEAWNGLEKRLAPYRARQKGFAQAGAQLEKARLAIGVQGRKWDLHAPPLPKKRRWGSVFSQCLCAFFLVYVFGWNLRALDFSTYGRFLPQSLNWIGFATRTDQVWDMFSPFPLKDDGWFLAPARLRDGTDVNLMQGGTPVQWKEPDNLSATFRDPLWQKYLLNLWSPANSAHRAYYAAYLVRQWNDHHDEKQRVKSLQLIYMQQTNLPNFRKDAIHKIVLWKQSF